MAEPITMAPALDTQRLTQGAHGRAALSMAPPQAQFVFRGAPSACAAAAEALGCPLPVTPCRSAQAGERAALWLGPDEWLLLAPADDAAALRSAMTASLQDIPHSLVEVSHRNVALSLHGEDASLLLNAGCPLDFDSAAFSPGMCTRTILAKATVIIWRQLPHTFYISAWRSFTPYIWDYLIEARTRL